MCLISSIEFASIISSISVCFSAVHARQNSCKIGSLPCFSTAFITFECKSCRLSTGVSLNILITLSLVNQVLTFSVNSIKSFT